MRIAIRSQFVWTLALGAIGAAAAFVMTADTRAQVPVAGAVPPADVVKLQEQRISTLREAAEHAKGYYEGGHGSLEEADRYKRMLVKAELDSAQSPQQRGEILQSALEWARHVEGVLGEKFKAGRTSRLALLEATAHRLEIQIELAKAKSKA